MSRLYNWIESNVAALINSITTDSQGNFVPNMLITDNKTFNSVLNVVTIILFILIVLIFGVFLWNQGLAAVTNIVKPIGYGSDINGVQMGPRQLRSKYAQLVVTLIALMILF